MENKELTFLTYISVFIIILAFFISWGYIVKQNKNNKLIEKRRWIEQLPSLISTLGVLGTFLGITVGLIYFDTTDLDNSIPLLLNGLKTAFFTSLAGMMGSLILSKIVSTSFDKNDKGISDINMASVEICNALKELKEQVVKQSQDQLLFYRNVSNSLSNLELNTRELEGLKSKIINIDSTSNSIDNLLRNIIIGLESTNNVSNTILVSIKKIEENSVSIKSSLLPLEEYIRDFNKYTTNMINLVSSISTGEEESYNEIKRINEVLNKEILTWGEYIKISDRNISEIVDITSAISSSQEETFNEVKKLGDVLRGEVADIELKMDETNNLLSQKFEEFSTLLKKSNTEALVEVMKKVTEEFQKQMNSLINKLIQENFEELNRSVEKLNAWQQENKEMITSLTKQYKDMALSFENTSSILNNVTKNTKLLVSDGGKLDKIISSLNKVLIEDKKFIEISTKLSETADLTKHNMEQFDTSTKVLNDWVRKQRNFVEGVQILIEKLEELNKIRNYNEQFWQSTKRSLEEGVGYIAQGSKTLNSQLTELDRQFYARLSTTLAELDACIQAMVKNSSNRRLGV